MQPTAAQLATTGGKAVEGAWYGGQRYMNGALLPAGQDQPGHDVSQEVIAQTNPNNVAFVNQQRQQEGLGPSPSNNNNNNNGNSGSGGMGSFGSGQPATPNLQALYDQYYTNNPDVTAANKSITDLQGQITQRRQALDEATKNINDNPFYAEATRTGKLAQLNNDAENDINTLNGQLTTAQTNLSNLQAEAERQVNMAQGQYSMDNQAWQQNLQEFNTLLSAGGLENASQSTLANLSVSTGIPTDMLSSIAQSEQAKNTQIFTTTDNSGNVTIAAVNSQTGKVVNTTTLGGVGAAKVGGGGSSKVNVSDGLAAMTPKILSRLNSYGNISPQDWNTALAAWMAAGLSRSDFVANFGQYADTNRGDFVQAYGFSNPKTAATIKNNQATNSKPVGQ